jgi:D-lactate dehydrogenase (cytochrome)
VSVIPYGAGTSLEGHILATQGGICIDLSQMNHILDIHEDDLNACVEAGVMRSQLDNVLQSTGLFFPVGPGADASLGGMAATSASGTNAVRYGTMKENVLGMTIVLADGRIIHTGGRTSKSASGYDLTHLFLGAEGTLGIITELTVRLYGRPAHTAAAVCAFESLAGAVNTVIKTIQASIPVARIELLDEVQIDAVNRYSRTDYPVLPTLFIEFQGTKTSVTEAAESVAALSSINGGGSFIWEIEAQGRKALWQARHDIAHACKALRPGCEFWSTDVCVPISRLAECILETRKDVDASGLTAPIVGHVGDGNFHVVMVLDPQNTEEVERCSAFNERLLMRALGMDGTITGEHGIGYGKRKYLRAEHGEAVDVMLLLKQSLDPLNIMNPGKVLPDD